LSNSNSLLSLLSTLTLQQRWLLLTFMGLKIALLWFVPLTGDEAYFIVWGQDLSLGYYDHPPAVGWVLYLLSGIADNLVVYRSFAFFAAIAIAYLLYQTLRLHPKVEKITAFYVAMAFLVSPISLMFVVTANDTVLVFFSVLGFFYYAKTLAQPTLVNALLAGLFLGMAFLSKYFAVFMLLGLFGYSLIYIKQYGWKLISFMVLIVLLFVAENLYFNATHCWNNILFNFFSRTTQSTFEIGNVLSYIAMIIGLLSPLGLYYLIQQARQAKPQQDMTLLPVMRQVLFASLPLLSILLLVSLTNPVGLHWPLLAVSLLYVLYALLPQQKLEVLYLFNGYISVVIGIVLLVALSFVDQLIPATQKHHVAVYTQPEKVCAQLPKSTFFTLGYSSQSALSYHCQNDDIHVFMSVSKFGREDDKKTNFKAMAGQDLKVFMTDEKDIKKMRPFFDNLAVETLKISDEVSYYLVEGKHFNYELYREQILKAVNENFYTAPEWFPKLSTSCGFKEKYDFK
jgi:hypothetical protein